MIYRPNSHEERFIPKGSVVLQKHEDFSKCGKDEWKVYPVCKNIRFNDVYATFTHVDGYTPNSKGKEESIYLEVGDWFLNVVTREPTEEPPPTEPPPEPTLEEKQINIFDILGG